LTSSRPRPPPLELVDRAYRDVRIRELIAYTAQAMLYGATTMMSVSCARESAPRRARERYRAPDEDQVEIPLRGYKPDHETSPDSHGVWVRPAALGDYYPEAAASASDSSTNRIASCMIQSPRWRTSSS